MMAFRCATSPTEEMERFKRLQSVDPESAANVVANGRLLVDYASRGEFRALQVCLKHISEGDVLAFHLVRMFRTACASHRLDILRLMIENGFDLQHATVRNILHDTVDAICVDDGEGDSHAQSLIRFLLDNGVDVNWQRKGDLFTALHIACSRNLYGIAYLLVLYGADVNAIALNDEMPLKCAKQFNCLQGNSKQQQLANDQLVRLLVENHARETWRKKAPASEPSTTASSCSRASRGKIMRFSASVSFQSSHQASESDSESPSGLMLDTMSIEDDL